VGLFIRSSRAGEQRTPGPDIHSAPASRDQHKNRKLLATTTTGSYLARAHDAACRQHALIAYGVQRWLILNTSRPRHSGLHSQQLFAS
jgi:hypothetical protein